MHAALIVGPAWFAVKQRPSPEPRVEARLVPVAAATTLADAVDSEADSTDTATAPRPVAQRKLQGAALRRTQSALSNHLFYPPEAVAMGLEGDVILLLSLTESGLMVSAVVARSSGYPVLDQAALDGTRHIGALPGNPRQTLFPVSFRLN